jgi:hypothetical protein
LVRQCFEGLGTIIPGEANFDTPTIRLLCETASADPTYQVFCKSFAAEILHSGGAGKKGDGVAVCSGLLGVYREYCVAYAKGTASSENPPPKLPSI